MSLPYAAMKRRTLLSLPLAAMLPGTARAQSFPTRPITIHVGYVAGSVDAAVRVLAAALTKDLGQPVLVVNQPGVSGTLAVTNVAHAPPDGHTLAALPSAWLRLPHLQKVTYDPLADVTYVIRLNTLPMAITVAQSAPWNSLPELLEYARANPAKVSFGGIGVGSPGHIAVERLGKAAGFKPVYVPFRGSGDLYGGLAGGHLQVVSEGGFGPFLEAGKIKALALMEAQRSTYWPKVPTAREQGFDVVQTSSIGIAGPKGLPAAVVQRLHDAFKRAMAQPEFVRVLETYGYPNAYLDSEQYRAWAIDTFALEKKLVAESGVKLEP